MQKDLCFVKFTIKFVQFFFGKNTIFLFFTLQYTQLGLGRVWTPVFCICSSTLVLASHSWVRNSGRVLLTKQNHSGQKSLWPKPDLQNGADISKLLWKGSILWLGGIYPLPPPPPPHVHISGGGGGRGAFLVLGGKLIPRPCADPAGPPAFPLMLCVCDP